MFGPITPSPEARVRRRVRSPALALTAFAWSILAIMLTADASPAADGATRGMAMGPPLHAPAMSAMSMHLSAASLPGLLGMWVAMLVAMMSPVLIGPLRHLGSHSLPGHRIAAGTLFVAAYATLWCVAGLLLRVLADALDRLGAPAAFAVALAVLWQFTPGKQRCLNGHHSRPPLAAFGWPAAVCSLRYGAQFALWCIGSCWTLMLLPLAVPTQQLAVMAAATLWIWAEQLEFPAQVRWRIRVPTRAILVARVAVTRLDRPRPAQL